MMGSADKVTVITDNTNDCERCRSKENISERVAQIKNESPIPRVLMIRRNPGALAKLAGGVAVPYVGANGEAEMNGKERPCRRCFVRNFHAAIEGVVAGGGTTYIRAIDALKDLKGDNADEQTGINIVERAIEEPFGQIVFNTGGRCSRSTEGSRRQRVIWLQCTYRCI